MKKNIQEILLEIDSIKSLLEGLGTSDKIKQLDYDLAMAKLTNVYSLMSNANKLKETIDIESVSELVEIKILSKLSEVIEKMIDQKIKTLMPSNENTNERITAAPKVEKKIIVEEIVISKEKSEQTILYEAIAEQNKPGESVYDMLSKDTFSTDLSSKMAYQSIADLEKVISLNEKFVFIKELFGGNAQQYSQTLAKLNSMSGIDEAMNFISSLSWDMKNTFVKEFLELIKRRYL